MRHHTHVNTVQLSSFENPQILGKDLMYNSFQERSGPVVNGRTQGSIQSLSEIIHLSILSKGILVQTLPSPSTREIE